MKKLALIYLLLAIIFTSCTPKHKTFYYHFDPQFWNYTDFWKQGTYWIMQDSATGQIDSLLIYNSDKTINRDNSSESDDTHIWDVYFNLIIDFVGVDTFSYMRLVNSSYDFENGGNFASLGFTYNRQDTNQGLQYNYYGYSYPGIITFPIHASNKWHALWYDSSNTVHPIFGSSFTELLPSYTVNNQTYDSVYHVHSIAPDSLLQLNDDFYYNRKHGILKIVQNNARIKRTLMLLRDHLIRE